MGKTGLFKKHARKKSCFSCWEPPRANRVVARAVLVSRYRKRAGPHVLKTGVFRAHPAKAERFEILPLPPCAFFLERKGPMRRGNRLLRWRGFRNDCPLEAELWKLMTHWESHWRFFPPTLARPPYEPFSASEIFV